MSSLKSLQVLTLSQNRPMQSPEVASNCEKRRKGIAFNSNRLCTLLPMRIVLPSYIPMAAPSSSSSASSKSRENFGVFLSFRGDDVRGTFVSRLHEKLSDKGVYPFIDSEALELGDKRDELFEAIEGSRIAVVTFSKDYGRSKWCLNELVKIMERKKLGKIVVLPVFYKVTPREVRLDEKEEGVKGWLKGWFSFFFKSKVKGCYQLAMEEMEARYGLDMANIWRQALWEGGDLIGEPVEDG